MKRDKEAALLNKRTRSIYRNQLQAAKKKSQIFSITLEQVQNLAIAAECCPYCQEPLKPKTISLDHKMPVERNGQHTLSNIAICCMRCNKIKGNMNVEEYVAFRQFISTMDDLPAKSIYRRIYAGGRFIYS